VPRRAEDMRPVRSRSRSTKRIGDPTSVLTHVVPLSSTTELFDSLAALAAPPQQHSGRAPGNGAPRKPMPWGEGQAGAAWDYCCARPRSLPDEDEADRPASGTEWTVARVIVIRVATTGRDRDRIPEQRTVSYPRQPEIRC
jgi:hypothetical protein